MFSCTIERKHTVYIINRFNMLGIKRKNISRRNKEQPIIVIATWLAVRNLKVNGEITLFGAMHLF